MPEEIRAYDGKLHTRYYEIPSSFALSEDQQNRIYLRLLDGVDASMDVTMHVYKSVATVHIHYGPDQPVIDWGPTDATVREIINGVAAENRG